MLLILKRCVLRPGWLLAPCVLALLSAGPASARSWDAIDALRDRLTRAGVRVVQQDCSRRGLQGLYHPRSDSVVVCRSHRMPAQVWDNAGP